MTTNQTIDGVRRELLLDIEYWLKHMEAEKSVEGRCSALKELRALLDKAEADIPASVPQVEPVEWQHRVTAGPQTGWSLWAPGRGKEWAEAYTVEVRPLYAEQPAPVAVVLPERKHVPDFTQHPLLNKEYTGWNACLDEVTRLNSTRPAHANQPQGTGPSGTHPHNDGLDDYRNTK